ncbi:MAG TPA: ATP-binding protein, partial [Candidatus Saccharimonadia bacterium]
DTGRGIPKDMQSLLFRKFQQAGSSLLTRDTTRGTGLGLYISKLLGEKMGGKISLENSEPGKGTTFSFSLPLATSEQIKASREHEAQPKSSA